MNNRRFRRPLSLSGILQSCKEHLITYKTIYTVILICGVGGFIIGIMGGAIYTRRTAIITITDGYIMRMTIGGIIGGSLFWSRILSLVGIFALMLLFSLHRYMMPLYCAMIVIRAFFAGFKIMLLIAVYNIAGFFGALIFILPFELIFFICVAYIAAHSIDRCLIYGKSGVPVRGRDGIIRILHRMIPATAVLLIFSIIEAILSPVFTGII